MIGFSRVLPAAVFAIALVLTTSGCREPNAPSAQAPESLPRSELAQPRTPASEPVAPAWLNQPPAPANPWEVRFVDAASPANKQAVIEEKAASGPEDLLGLAKLALADASPQVSITALLVAPILRGQDAVDLFSAVPFHRNPGVRRVGIEAVRELPRAERLDTYRKLIASADGETLELIIGDLANEARKPAFEILLQSYADPDPEIRTLLNREVNRLVGRQFQSLDEALAWWAEAGPRFNDKLYEERP